MGKNPDQTHLIVLAGPNGAGKSTAAPALLAGALGIQDFVNADVIAQGLSGFQPEAAAMEAGKIMLRRLRELAEGRLSFAFETTLAARSYAPWIAELMKDGYAFDLFFLWLPSADQAVLRVRERVRAGGHDIPEEAIRRRYEQGPANFFGLYQPIATTWQIYDNSDPSGMQLVAHGVFKTVKSVANAAIWDKIVRSAK
jgi:predicted ABC-type ATPase